MCLFHSRLWSFLFAHHERFSSAPLFLCRDGTTKDQNCLFCIGKTKIQNVIDFPVLDRRKISTSNRKIPNLNVSCLLFNSSEVRKNANGPLAWGPKRIGARGKRGERFFFTQSDTFLARSLYGGKSLSRSRHLADFDDEVFCGLRESTIVSRACNLSPSGNLRLLPLWQYLLMSNYMFLSNVAQFRDRDGEPS